MYVFLFYWFISPFLYIYHFSYIVVNMPRKYLKGEKVNEKKRK